MSEPPLTPLLPPTASTPPSHLPLLPSSATTTTSSNREYRKGNWTIQETLILITAKKLDEDRRSKPNNLPLSSSSPKPAELRWKWVENYCWAHGCFRSQNQCNDKWDNLLRDYKKIRDYELRSSNASSSGSFTPSYWNMDRHQRKDHNLPSNLSLEVYEALHEVVQRKYHNITPQMLISTQQQQQHDRQEQHQRQEQQLHVVSSAITPVTVRPTAALPATEVDAPVSGESSGTKETSEKLDTKRRRGDKKVGSSIMKSAKILARTIRNCEEKKDKRHREVMEIEQRRLQIQEAQIEANRQSVSNLVNAVNDLSTAIQSFISRQS
ncbi:hypothetical protein K2173_008979 [Erythroxylum novogranatense]|uniref:Myb-like domain-containing protein n=1 Tax=Erythroxylum novogranatense TaxID=1862640 RepID=A0AAV8TSB9_9ROSI|nr:hypothetical protein K2173_008979 [Erythroxylum novogranatense]